MFSDGTVLTPVIAIEITPFQDNATNDSLTHSIHFEKFPIIFNDF